MSDHKHISCLQSKQQHDGLQAVFSSVNIISQKQIVNMPEGIYLYRDTIGSSVTIPDQNSQQVNNSKEDIFA